MVLSLIEETMGECRGTKYKIVAINMITQQLGMNSYSSKLSDKLVGYLLHSDIGEYKLVSNYELVQMLMSKNYILYTPTGMLLEYEIKLVLGIRVPYFLNLNLYNNDNLMVLKDLVDKQRFSKIYNGYKISTIVYELCGINYIEMGSVNYNRLKLALHSVYSALHIQGMDIIGIMQICEARSNKIHIRLKIAQIGKSNQQNIFTKIANVEIYDILNSMSNKKKDIILSLASHKNENIQLKWSTYERGSNSLKTILSNFNLIYKKYVYG